MELTHAFAGLAVRVTVGADDPAAWGTALGAAASSCETVAAVGGAAVGLSGSSLAATGACATGATRMRSRSAIAPAVVSATAAAMNTKATQTASSSFPMPLPTHTGGDCSDPARPETGSTRTQPGA